MNKAKSDKAENLAENPQKLAESGLQGLSLFGCMLTGKQIQPLTRQEVLRTELTMVNSGEFGDSGETGDSCETGFL